METAVNRGKRQISHGGLRADGVVTAKEKARQISVAHTASCSGDLNS